MKNFKYAINGNVYKVKINRIEDTIAEVIVNGESYNVEIKRTAKKENTTAARRTRTAVVPVIRPKQTNAGFSALRAPLPGIILDIFCTPGDKVKKGQNLLILEAMKMENTLSAEKEGIVKEIKVNTGDSVLEGDELVIFE